MKNVKDEDVKDFYNTMKKLEEFFGATVHIVSQDKNLEEEFQQFKKRIKPYTKETKIEDISSE